MSTAARSSIEARSESETTRTPAINVCEGRPGRSVFMEVDNTDGWIASDLVVDVSR
ncbi:hypothetical protein [Halorubrum depositum]|uniref:hypothetical protein n=1 Tax=Halorubrum depositum TaxID=2583992 RepID=UPI0016432B7B|nr:hypothetical protein [Halorubrum depositum]